MILQNDYQGYVDNIKRGKPEEDIQLGQCTWFIVQALKQANPEQKTILKVSSHPDKVVNSILYFSVKTKHQLPHESMMSHLVAAVVTHILSRGNTNKFQIIRM